MAAALAAVAVTALAAACGGGGDTSASGDGAAKTEVRLGYFPNITHATALVGVEKGYLRQGTSAATDAEDRDLQRRPGRDRGALLRRHRRHLHRPEPGHQRLGQVQGRGHQDRRRRRVRRRVPGRQARASTRAADLKGKKIATPAARQHPGRRAALLAEGARASTTDTRAAATSRSCRRRTPRPCRPSRPATSTAPGCPSPAPAGWSARARARCSSTRRDLWPDGSSSPPTSSSRRSSSRSTPTWSRSCSRRTSRRTTYIKTDPAEAPGGVNAEIAGAHRQAAQARGPAQRVQEPHVHQRPDRVVAARPAPSTPRRSACSSRST